MTSWGPDNLSGLLFNFITIFSFSIDMILQILGPGAVFSVRPGYFVFSRFPLLSTPFFEFFDRTCSWY